MYVDIADRSLAAVRKRMHDPRLRLAPVLLVLALLVAIGVPALDGGALSGPLRLGRTSLALAHSSQPGTLQAPSLSTDWSGYATSGGTFTRVAGSWTQPAATCASPDPDVSAGESYAAFWIGLDGDTTRTVEQIGTDSDCSQGHPVYYAWYEMYPAYPVTLANPVAAGDHISASVTSDGGGAFTLRLSDTNQHWTFITQARSSRAALASAEWIVEAPSDGRRTLPLADFGTITFTDCSANGVAIGQNPNVDEIALADPYGGVEAEPSSLTSGGTSFSVTSATSAEPGSTGSVAPPAPPPPSSSGHHRHWHGWGQSNAWGNAGL